jgi:hypothetical protein
MVSAVSTNGQPIAPEGKCTSEPLVNPLRRGVRWSFWLMLLLGPGVGLALTPVGVEAAVVGWILGGVFGLTMLIVTLALWWYAGRIDRRLAAFQAGDYLVHWTYTEAEWLGFAQAEWEQQQRDARTTFYVLLGIFAFTGLIIGIAVPAGLNQSGVLAYAIYCLLGLAGGSAVGALIGWLCGAIMRRNGRRRYERMCAQVGEAYIGHDAAYCADRYWAWKMLGVSLAEIQWLEGDPARIQFTVRTHTAKGNIDHMYRIPVPAGKEREAGAVFQALAGNRP